MHRYQNIFSSSSGKTSETTAFTLPRFDEPGRTTAVSLFTSPFRDDDTYR
jgi:hypothetical protein